MACCRYLDNMSNESNSHLWLSMFRNDNLRSGYHMNGDIGYHIQWLSMNSDAKYAHVNRHTCLEELTDRYAYERAHMHTHYMSHTNGSDVVYHVMSQVHLAMCVRLCAYQIIVSVITNVKSLHVTSRSVISCCCGSCSTSCVMSYHV